MPARQDLSGSSSEAGCSPTICAVAPSAHRVYSYLGCKAPEEQPCPPATLVEVWHLAWSLV